MSLGSKRKPWRGFAAGALGGLAASFAMGQFHALFQTTESSALPRNRAARVSQRHESQAREDSTVQAANAISQSIFHHSLTPEQKKLAGPAMHYGFGASVASLYGTVSEFAPLARVGWGMAFGAAVWLGAHVIAVPALGLSAPVRESTTPRKEAGEFGAHLLYGVVVEGVRRFVRRYMLR